MSTNTTHYFSHDADARHDPKIVCMMNIFGAEGYGIYWCIIEILREEKDFRYRIDNKYWAEGLAGECKVSSDKIKKFIDVCVDVELFQSNEQFFWSESLNKRMGKMVDIIENAKKAANTRWNRYRKNKKEEAEKDEEIVLDVSPSPTGKILFNRTKGRFEGITQKDKDMWAEQYQFLDIEEELFQMAEYWKDRPEEAKKKGDTWRTAIASRLYYQSKHFEGDKSQGYESIKEKEEMEEEAMIEKRNTQERIIEMRKESKDISPNLQKLIRATINQIKGD